MNSISMPEIHRAETRDRYDCSTTCINDLPEDMLTRILLRTNCPASIARSKSVSKRWNNLISSSSQQPSDPLALIVFAAAPDQPLDEPHYCSENPNFKTPITGGFNLKFLPFFTNKRSQSSGPACVFASDNGLLICSEDPLTQRDLYLCNPMISQFIKLPINPAVEDDAVSLCPPKPIGVVVSRNNRYKVVRLRHLPSVSSSSNWMTVQVLDSSTDEWTEHKISLPDELSELYPFVPSHYHGVTFNSALHWLTYKGPILVYDPSDPETRSQFRIINRSTDMETGKYRAMSISECISVCQGFIYMLQVITFDYQVDEVDELHKLVIWKLEDYENSQWVMANTLHFKEMISEIAWVQSYVCGFKRVCSEYSDYRVPPCYRYEHLDDYNNRWSDFGRRHSGRIHHPSPLACHPCKPHVVYIHFPHCIMSCNLRTKKLKLVSQIDFPRRLNGFDVVCPLILPM